MCENNDDSYYQQLTDSIKNLDDTCHFSFNLDGDLVTSTNIHPSEVQKQLFSAALDSAESLQVEKDHLGPPVHGDQDDPGRRAVQNGRRRKL